MSIDLLASLLKEESSGNHLDDLKLSVLRNIKWLLESRQSLNSSNNSQLVSRSLYMYGLSARNFGRSNFQWSRLGREIEQLLVQFEPRLQDVVVDVEKSGERNNRLYFRIEGVLQLQVEFQKQVPIAFNSVLNLTSAHVSIEEYHVAQLSDVLV